MIEATLSAIIQFLNSVKPYVNFYTLVISGITFVCGLLFRGFAKELFDERARKRKHKQNVVREVHILINEASTNRYSERPRSVEHVNSVLSDVDGIDKEIGVVMRKFVELWRKPKIEVDDIVTVSDEIEKNEKILTAWVNKNS